MRGGNNSRKNRSSAPPTADASPSLPARLQGHAKLQTTLAVVPAHYPPATVLRPVQVHPDGERGDRLQGLQRCAGHLEQPVGGVQIFRAVLQQSGVLDTPPEYLTPEPLFLSRQLSHPHRPGPAA